MAYGDIKATQTDAANILAGYNLAERQLNAVLNFLNGLNKEDACLASGYAKGSSGMVFRSARVQAAIAAVMDRYLLGDLAPTAMHTLSRLLASDETAAGVKTTIALGILDRAGFTAKRHEKADAARFEAANATPDQLQAEIDRLQAEIDAKLRDVTPVDEPDDSQAVDLYP
jgi:hypothetical protein